MSCSWVRMENVCHVLGCAWRMCAMSLDAHGQYMLCVWVCVGNVCHGFGCTWIMYVMHLDVHGECHMFGCAWIMWVMCLAAHGEWMSCVWVCMETVCFCRYSRLHRLFVKSLVVCTACLQPEFGKPLESPPRRLYPIKFMSPPSTASSILSVNSRTEGEGNEDGQCQCFASYCQISISCF